MGKLAMASTMHASLFVLSLLLNVTYAYNGNTAVSWADSNCGFGSTECAEFVSDAIAQGGFSSCFNKWAPSLVSCLEQSGWSRTSLPGPPGSVVVYSDSQGPYHVALSRGDGTCDQHNHDDCKVTCNWASNIVLAPPNGPSPGPSPPGPSPPGPSPPGACAACVSGGGGQACLPKCNNCGSTCTQCIQNGGGMACASRCQNCGGFMDATAIVVNSTTQGPDCMLKCEAAGYNPRWCAEKCKKSTQSGPDCMLKCEAAGYSPRGCAEKCKSVQADFPQDPHGPSIDCNNYNTIKSCAVYPACAWSHFGCVAKSPSPPPIQQGNCTIKLKLGERFHVSVKPIRGLSRRATAPSSLNWASDSTLQ